MAKKKRRDKKQQQARLAALQQVTLLDPRDVATHIRQRDSGRQEVRQAKQALTPEQRGHVFIVEKNDKGIAVRKLPRPLDRMHNRGELGRSTKDAHRRYQTGQDLERIHEFVESGYVSCVKWDNQPAGERDSAILERRAAARMIYDDARTACEDKDHWDILHRVVCLGQPIGKGGRNDTRTRGLLDALDFLDDRRLLRRY